MAGPTPFEMAKMNSPVLGSGEFAVTEIADGLTTLERLDPAPSRTWRVARVVLWVLGVGALVTILAMPAILR